MVVSNAPIDQNPGQPRSTSPTVFTPAQALTAALALLFAPPAGAVSLLLYDPAAGTLPQAQDWLTYIAPVGPAAQQTAEGAAVDTTNAGASADDANLAAGFFNHSLSLTLFPPADSWALKNAAFPELDPARGFSVSFALRLRDEDHDGGTTGQRAGFSIILLAKDLTGIELGFWEDQVWAQSGPDFQRAESAVFDTTVGTPTYALTIETNRYRLTADGVALLTGPTRNYSAANPFPDPYNSPNMLFLGDDTGSAAADFTLGRVLLTPDLAAAPVPPTPLLLLAPLGWLARRRRRTPHR